MPLHQITADPGGRPTIAGTQVTVEAILKELAASAAVDALVTSHPELDRDAVHIALEYAVWCVRGTSTAPGAALTQAMGDFQPTTPLAHRLWERRKAVMQEALARGEPLLQSWEEVEQEVRERRGTRDLGETP